MNRSYQSLLLSLLLIMPCIVFASSEASINEIWGMFIFEIVYTIILGFFFWKKLIKDAKSDNARKFYKILFFLRILLLITYLANRHLFMIYLDLIMWLIIMCIYLSTRDKSFVSTQAVQAGATASASNELRCPKCKTLLIVGDKFCPTCGTQVTDVVNPGQEQKQIMTPANFDPIYSLSEKNMIEKFLEREIEKAGIDKSSKLIPSDILKRKKILNIIFSFLVFVFVVLIFFHFPIYTYAIGLILLIVFFILTRRYNLIKYLKKQLESRPSEKIINIVMNAKNTMVSDNSRGLFAICLLVAIILPLIIFINPRIIYEKVDGGYAVRYYAFGLTNFKTVEIPETHNNESIVSLRGNAFSNMFFLESVKLPNTITEIRGQAFKNCIKLKSVVLPNELKYLGGGAFYNAVSLESIELPDSLTELGGESFYNAESLIYVKLPANLTEIHGDTFEYCVSLRSITIPDSVTRIGGHAFYGDINLSEVIVSENSRLSEIGSSAFRQCDSLSKITLPSRTYINERAFKESPTIIYRHENSNNY